MRAFWFGLLGAALPFVIACIWLAYLRAELRTIRGVGLDDVAFGLWLATLLYLGVAALVAVPLALIGVLWGHRLDDRETKRLRE